MKSSRARALSILLAIATILGVTALSSALAAPPSFEAKSFEATITENVGYQYLLALPNGYNSHAGKKWPLLIYLHGSGERGNDLNRLFGSGVPKLMAAGKNFDAIVACPQLPDGEVWNPRAVKALVDTIKAGYHIDDSRVYITGLSLGGIGTWETICTFPGVFAGAVPIAGAAGVDAVRFDHLQNLPPVWAFHGDADNVVPVALAIMSQNLAKAAGRNTRLTLYKGVGHDSWTQTYANGEMWRWLFSQQRRD